MNLRVAMIELFLLSIYTLSISSHFLDPLPDVNVQDFEQLWFENKVDHYNYQDTSTYSQRYWVNDKYWDRESGPVFLYICGEYTCSVPEDRMYPFQVGAENNALLMVLEHRFYGESQPGNDWSLQNLKLLSAQQALSDLAYFVSQQKDQLKTEFIVIGGSYPGALSAWFKARYPNLALASWASSASIQQIINIYQMDYQVYVDTKISGDFCYQYIQNITQFVTQQLNYSSNSVLDIFDASGMNHGDFMYYFADIFLESVQYGSRTWLCDQIKNISQIEDQYQQLKILKEIGDYKDIKITDYCRKSLLNETIDFNLNLRQWTYQYCTEFGFFQVPYEPQPMRSHLLEPPYWYDYCQAVFPDMNYTQPQYNQTISELAGIKNFGSNIFFVNGIEDPWQSAGMLNSTKEQEEIGQIVRIADCVNCAHCVEIYNPKDTDSQNLKNIREEIRHWIRGILQGRNKNFLQ